MASTLEREGFRLKLTTNADGTFSLNVHNGGPGVSDQSLETQGIRMQIHDNGDGTFSPAVTTSTGVNDLTLEFEGFRLKIHPTGENDPVTGEPMYALVVVNV